MARRIVAIIMGRARIIIVEELFVASASAGPGARQKRNKGSGTIALRATTVDAFVAARRVERVHVLEVDANGMDALVLEGAAQDPNPNPNLCAQDPNPNPNLHPLRSGP